MKHSTFQPGRIPEKNKPATLVLWIIMILSILNGSALAQRYAGVWQESDKKERVLADAAWPLFEETNKKLMARKFRLEDIEIYESGGQKKYAAVWHSGTDSCEIFAENWTLFQQKMSSLSDKSMRLVDIETYVEGNERKFLGVWRSGKYNQKVQVGLTWDDFQRTWETYGKDDLRLMDVETYIEDRVRKYAGIWSEGKQEYRLWRDLDWKTFSTIWQGLREQGFYLVDLETYVSNNERKFMGAWLKGNTNEHRILIDLTWNDYFAKWQEIGRDNIWLIDLEIY